MSGRWPEGTRRGPSWRRLLFPAIFLAVLGQTATGIDQFSHGVGLVAGYAILAAFCLTYLVALVATWGGRTWLFWVLFSLMVGLWVAEMPFARSDASVMCIFIAVLCIARLGTKAVPLVVALALITVFAPAAVASRHEGVDTGGALSICMISFAMYAFFALVRSNQELTEARSEVARLAAENERSRIARDLHDLLGHSLTTITVKAGLARRLAATDPQRSLAEIAEVEALSRRSLADVRAVVTNYREVTLTGELAAGRELLRAAGIDAHLPSATDLVDPGCQALFGWVVREGLTNVVRHAHATTCTVTLGPDWLDIVDNGVGGDSDAGNGLQGLRERIEAAGGSIEAAALTRGGWRVHASVPPAP